MSNHKLQYLFLTSFAVFLLLAPELAHADLVGSINSVKVKLTQIILPAFSVIGICIAAISFFTGNPNSKQHIFYAILGCLIGFGSQAIVDFIRESVR